MSTATTANKKESDKFKNLLGATDPKLDREVREILITARVGLLLRASFFGNLATRLKLVNADEWCPTAATDGRNFYYNTRFIKMLKPKEVEFLFGHEVLHCVYDHFGRRGDRDPQLFNIANDYCVNADLKKHRVGEFITSVPCLYDPKYQDMSSEEIYDILYENAEKIDIGSLIDKMLDEHLDGEGDNEGSGKAVTKTATVGAVPNTVQKKNKRSVMRSKKQCWRPRPQVMVLATCLQVSNALSKT
jgi:predicted metal-dependent peptidase